MPVESRWNSSFLRRAEQLKRWEQSETINIPPKDKKTKIRFTDVCVFLDACSSNDTEEAERLLASGTDINTSKIDGLTALHQACLNSNLEMVKFLVNHQCDVNRADNDGWTPLHSAAANGFLSIAKFLVEHGANSAAFNCDGHLPIDVSESSEMVEYLSDVLDEKGIDVDEARSEEERIMMADAGRMLAGDFIDVGETIHPLTGATALHVAAAKGYCEVMEVLVQANVDLNAQDNEGWTPLHAAAHWSQRSACTILAENLANMDVENLAGQTCFDVAHVGMIVFLGDLKTKQISIQKALKDYKEIPQRTNIKPQLKEKPSETRIRSRENNKSAIKDTKSQIEQMKSMALPENENYKMKKLNERIFFINKSPAMKTIQKPLAKPNPFLLLRTPSMKTATGCAFEGSVAKLIFKKTSNFDDDLKGKEDDGVKRNKQPSILPVLGEESKLQRKTYCKRVREIRRPTQGVLLEDSAKFKYSSNSHQEGALGQPQNVPSLDGISNSKSHSNIRNWCVKSKSFSEDDFKENGGHSSETKKQRELSGSEESPSSLGPENEPFVGIVLPTRHVDSTRPSANKPPIGTPAADHSDCPRFKSGFSILDSASDNSSQGEFQKRESEEKEYKMLYEETMNENEKLKEAVRQKQEELKKTKKALQRLFESNVLKMSASETIVRSLKRKNYASEAERKLLERENSTSEAERRSLEQKISELEDKLKQMENFRADNYRLKEETAVLIRVISKISR